MNKKVILSSVLSLTLCLSLIVGGTFALFTSESAVDISITSGKVQVNATLEKATEDWIYSPTSIKEDGTGDLTNAANLEEGLFKNGGTAVLSGEALTLTNVTPGDKVNLNVKVENLSNVTAQYQTVITATADDGLFGGLIVTIDGEAYDGLERKSPWTTITPDVTDVDNIPVTIELPAAAGNEYQEKSCTVQIKVLAVQGNALTEPVAQVLRMDKADLQLTSLTDDFGVGALTGELLMDAGYIFTATESAEEAAASPFAQWHADFVVTIDKEIEAGALALAGYYENFGSWMAFANADAMTPASEIRLLKDVAALAVPYQDLPEMIGEFQCGVAALYDSAIGTTVTVELRLYEADGNQLDNENGEYIVIGEYSHKIGSANTADKPEASVTSMPAEDLAIANFDANSPIQEALTLDAGFLFAATETAEEAAASPYAKWHADFVVTTDKDVAAGAIALAGQYDFFSEGWVAFTSEEEIAAGTEIRLLEGYGLAVNYEELCELVKEFYCGVAALDPSAAGTTVTVELRLYEADGAALDTESGNYNVIGLYSYTL